MKDESREVLSREASSDGGFDDLTEERERRRDESQLEARRIEAVLFEERFQLTRPLITIPTSPSPNPNASSNLFPPSQKLFAFSTSPAV